MNDAVAETEISEASKPKPEPVAVWSGIALTLPNGRVIPFLFCSANAGCNGFFVEGAKPSNEDEDMVECLHCRAPHYVVPLPDLIEEGLMSVEECWEPGPSILLDALLAIMMRGGSGRENVRRES
jgi:hypothetical protein